MAAARDGAPHHDFASSSSSSSSSQQSSSPEFSSRQSSSLQDSTYTDAPTDDLTTQQTNSERLEEQWRAMYRRLVEYQEQHGDCNVPNSYPPDKALGKWVRNQRQNLKNKPLDTDRRKILDSIGFAWQRKERASWDVMFDRLVAYKQQHGDCNVPLNYHPDLKLATWVSKQRCTFKNAPLNNERRQRLDKIGFYWTLEKRRSKSSLSIEADHEDDVALPAEFRREATKQSSANEDRVIRYYSSFPGTKVIVCEGIHGPVVFGSFEDTLGQISLDAVTRPHNSLEACIASAIRAEKYCLGDAAISREHYP